MRELQFIDYGGLSRLNWFGVSREELFPEESEEERRLKGRFRKFKSVEEISNEDIDVEFGNLDTDDDDIDLIDPETEYWDLIFRFGDGEFDKPNTIIQPEEEDKKSVSENFVPFSRNKIKCKINSYKRKF